MRWYNYSKEKPTVDGRYFCKITRDHGDEFYVLNWAKDLYKVDSYDFSDEKGVSGFYDYDSEWGYAEWEQVDFFIPAESIDLELTEGLMCNEL
jgi:hypothetical protein